MKKLYNIEFLRIFFAMAIVYFHILHSNFMSYTGGGKYLFRAS